MRLQGFVGPTYTLSSVNADCQRSVNLYPELDELHTASNGEVASLRVTPGLTLRVALGTGPVRALWYSEITEKLYAVSGTGLYQVNSDWSSVLLATVNGTGSATICDNGIQLFILTGGLGYVMNLPGTTVLPVVSPGFYPGGSSVVSQDGYIILARPNTDIFYISGLNDAGNYDLLDFQSIGGTPDYLVSIASINRLVWMLGRKTTQIWVDTGAAAFPFERFEGSNSEYGCSASQSVERFANALCWLGGGPNASGIVLMTQGNQPVRISNHAVEVAIAAAGDVSDAVGWSYQEDGHPFYILTLPGASTSWCYDLSTQQWHERAYWDGGAYTRHRGNCCALAYRLNVVGDWENGNLYSLDSNCHTDNGNPLVWMRRSPHMSADMKRIFFHSAQFDLEMGTALSTGQGSDPTIFLRYSDDFGHTWSNEKTSTTGKIGEYRNRSIFRRLGSSRQRVFELRGSDPIANRILGAEVTATAGIK